MHKMVVVHFSAIFELTQKNNNLTCHSFATFSTHKKAKKDVLYNL